MRPVFKAGLRRVWRDATTLQIGVDPRRAVVVSDLSPPLGAVLDMLDGTRTAADIGAVSPEAGHLLGLLADAGVLDDAAHSTGTLPALTVAERDRLGPDLASLALVEPAPGAATLRLARRQASRVRVAGAGRVGTHLAALLVAAGVGMVTVDDDGVATAADVAPGGLRLDDVGRSRSAAAEGALARVGRPRTAAHRRPAGSRPDLVILAPASLPLTDLDEAVELERSGIPHLVAGVRETTGVVGPLVLPGRSACLACQHLHRTDRDRAWPVLLAQLLHLPPAVPPTVDPCDVALAAMVAGSAALQALEHLDGRAGGGARGAGAADAVGALDDGDLPATAGGTLEITLPDWRLRRRTWPVHPCCWCSASRAERAFAVG